MKSVAKLQTQLNALGVLCEDILAHAAPNSPEHKCAHNVLDALKQYRDAPQGRGACIIVCRYINGRVHVLGIEGPKGTGLPGGRIDPGETPQVAAARELEEETGYAVKPGATLVPLEVRLTDNGDLAHGFWLREEDLFGEPRASAEGTPHWYPIRDLVHNREGKPPVRFPLYNHWAFLTLFGEKLAASGELA